MLIESRNIKLQISDLAAVYNLRTYDSSRFVLQLKSGQVPLSYKQKETTGNGNLADREWISMKANPLLGNIVRTKGLVERGKLSSDGKSATGLKIRQVEVRKGIGFEITIGKDILTF